MCSHLAQLIHSPSAQWGSIDVLVDLICLAAVQPATLAGALRALDRLRQVSRAVLDAIRMQTGMLTTSITIETDMWGCCAASNTSWDYASAEQAVAHAPGCPGRHQDAG